MYCKKCGKEFSEPFAFCSFCGTPQGTDGGTSVIVRKKPIAPIVDSAVVVLLIAAVVFFFLTSANELSGKYANGTDYNGNYYYILEFKSNDICLWTQEGSTFSGTYEYLDGEYIIQIKGNGYYLSTTFRAEKRGDSLFLTGGVFRGSEFVKIR